ncbi:bacterioferritin [Caproiciproducens sp. NJN-50]|uniref:ferritin-like domain-containing protein n=1 Tax=Acutalibacteraceae TaxID=3082771 RepID=UPI000FFDFEE9|nr:MULTISPECIES: manganese catalase family protein [Acutalibacteraceae]QAT49592.1 bacterioferritin [Caproiciproducens sp. NJN-50]
MAQTSSKVIYRGYTDSSPYPPAKVSAPNKQYANLLMDDFAGPKGEFTAMSTYFYHHYTAAETTGDYGVMTMRIAIAEMNHMNILSSLIGQLGGEPVFRGGFNSGGKYWTSRNVLYTQDLKQKLQNALEGEIKAIENYQKHITLIDDPLIKKVLERIILDEELHKSYIIQTIAAMKGSGASLAY